MTTETDYLIDRHEVERRVCLTRSSIYDAMRAGAFSVAAQGWTQGRALAVQRY